MATLEDLIVRVGADTSDAEKSSEGLASAFDSNFARITAAGVAAGAGLEAFARSQQDSNVQTRQMAAALGISEDAMRDMAIETSNVTFPLDQVLDLMETGKQRGITSGNALQEYASFWDMVGDATGEAGPELGAAGVALEAVGVSAGQETEALAAFGFITESTTGSVGDFLSFLERTGPELRELGADVNDSAAILGILESEFGMTGRTARTEFRQAVNESEGDMNKLLDTLGISEDQFAAMRSEVEASGDVIERNAGIYAESFTPLQRLQHAAEEMMFRYGGLADAAGALALPLMALGPILHGVSLAFKAINVQLIAQKAALVASKVAMVATAVATGVWAAAQWLLNVALTANPIGIIIVAIAALVAIIVLIATKTTWFQDLWNAIWSKIGDPVKAVWGWIKKNWPLLLAILTGPIGLAVLFIIKNWDKIKAGFQTVVRAISGAITWVKDKFKAGWTTIRNLASKVFDFYKGIPGKLKAAFLKVAGFVSAPFIAGFNAVSNAWNATIGNLSWTIPSWVPGIGGNSISAPKLPTFHTGGIVGGIGEQLAVVRAGEGVFTPDQMRALGGSQRMTLELRSGGTRLDDLLVDVLARSIRNRGGNVQLVLGGH